jgi:hypothetical protein
MLPRASSKLPSAFALLLANNAVHATGDVIPHQIEQDGTALLLRPTWRF